jgi:hypothetical protein
MRITRHIILALVGISGSAAFAVPCLAGAAAEGADQDRPFVARGITDKPFMDGDLGRTSIGGYTEALWRWERADGVTEELTFEMKRFNLFAYAPVSDRVRVTAELEFEEGGEEIKVEAALLDFEIHPAVTLRGGILLAPLGRFNLAHDSPANDLTDRPLVSTQIIPTTLSEAGMGVYGALFPTDEMRVTYELYGVNGFNDGVLEGDPDGTRIAAGKGNFEDNNNRPALVGRLSVSPAPSWELGASTHTGAYNTWMAEDLVIDEKRSVTILALDGEWRWRQFEVLGEYASASVDVPPETGGLSSEDQQGYYIQLNAHGGQTWLAALPGSQFTGAIRYGLVDFDTNGDGDTHRRLTIGGNFRPQQDTVFKIDYQRNWTRDAFQNQGKGAALIFSMATYF